MDQEAIIRGLAAALPEAFAGRDLREAYAESGEPEHDWLAYIAVPDARTWIEHNALDIDHDACVARVRPGGEDALRRYFDYFETLASDPGPDVQNLLMIELLRATPSSSASRRCARSSRAASRRASCRCRRSRRRPRRR